MSLRILAAVLVVLAARASYAHADQPRPCDPSAAPALATGLRVQVDPETGTYSMPAPAPTTSAGDRGARAAARPLVVEPGATTAGGYKVRLPDTATPEER